MKFGSINFPPRKKKDEESEFVPSERPEALSTPALVELVRANDLDSFGDQLEAYIDKWQEYATDHDVFLSADIKSMREGRRRALLHAKEVARLGRGNFSPAVDDLEKELNDIIVEFPKGIVATATTNDLEKSEERKSVREREEMAESAFKKSGPVRAEELGTPLMEVTAEGRIPLELTEEQELPSDATHGEVKRKLEKMLAPESERISQREQKAEKFAEKYGLIAERAALLEAEQEYAAAVRAHHSKNFRFRENPATRAEQEKLDAAVLNWRNALEDAGEMAEKNGEKRDAISARFISAREAMIPRGERTRQQAMREGMSERDKTLIGKFDNRMTAAAMTAVKAAGWFGNKFGKLSEGVGSAVAGKVIGTFIDKETDLAKYQRASRILGSSLIMTAVFAPAGAAAAGAIGSAFLWRVVRGFGGWGLGAAAGSGSGKVYERIHGSEEERGEQHLENRDELMRLLRDKSAFMAYEAEDLKKIFKKGSRQEHAKQEQTHAQRQALLELGVSTLVAGSSAYGISQWGAVHEAATALHPGHAVGNGPSNGPDASGPHTTGTETIAKPVHIDSVKVDGQVNNADKLMGRFMDNIKHQFPDSQNVPPALRTLLDHYHKDHGMHQQDVLTRFLKLQDGGSSYIHPGDTVSFDGQNVLLNGHVLVDNKGAIHSVPGLRFDGAHVTSPEGHHVRVEEPTAPKASIPAEAPDKTEAPQPVPQPETVQPSPIQPDVVTNVAPAPAPAFEAQPEAPPAAPMPETPPSVVPDVKVPSVVPDTVPVETAPPAPVMAEAAPAPIPLVEGLNLNGFDLLKPNVGMDKLGNLFAHIKWTGDLAKDNQLSYQTAMDYASKHHDAIVYYVNESRSALGTPDYTVVALKWNDQVGYPHVIIPDHDNPYNMPKVPTDTELRPIKP